MQCGNKALILGAIFAVGVGAAGSGEGDPPPKLERFLVPPARHGFNPYYVQNLPDNPYSNRFDVNSVRNLDAPLAAAREELASLERAGEGDSASVADLLEYMIHLTTRIGNYGPEMLEWAERAVRIKQARYGPGHEETAEGLLWLAHVLLHLGRYGEARETLVAVFEEHGRPVHEDLMYGGLLRLVEVLMREGDYEQARRVFDEIALKVMGAGTQSVASILATLGDYEQAAVRLEREYHENKRPPDRVPASTYATVLNNLAILLAAGGDLPRADELSRRAVEIELKYYRPIHPRLRLVRYNRALILAQLGRLDESLVAFRELVAIEEQCLAPTHPERLLTLLGLANVLTAKGLDGEAGPIYELLLSRSVPPEGQPHPQRSSMLAGAAWHHWRTGREGQAVRLALEAESLERRHFKTMISAVSEREALLYETIRLSGLDLGLTYLTSGGAEIRPEVVWNELVNSRCLVLDQLALRNRFVLAQDDAETRTRLSELSLARSELARLAFRTRNVDDGGMVLADARMAKERAERTLAELGQRIEPDPETSIDAIARALPPETALVAYVVHEDLRAADRQLAYLAFILGTDHKVRVVPIGAASWIDGLARDWRESVARDPRAAPEGPELAEAQHLARSRELRRAVWDPVARHVRPARRVLIVPDGDLHRVSFAVLAREDGGYLVESEPSFHYLTAERDLAPAGRGRTGSGVLVLGNPAFDDVDGTLVSASEAEFTYRGPGPDCGRVLSFAPLAGSQAEVAAIQALWVGESIEREQVHVLTGKAAGEAAWKREAPSHRILHLAVHGFSLGEDCASSSRAGDSLLLSGLALAGANRPPDGLDREDGILTAEEIASLDLRGVEWAVLSGCDTGLGGVTAGEGVLGLRRAFQLAGARSTIMSLWQVRDDSARLWMEALYRARLSGSSTAESVRQASLQRLRDLRGSGRSTHPFFWGVFVAAGDWR